MKTGVSERIQRVENMQDQPVLVVGDIMLDRFIYGSVERISPESPVPVLSISRESLMPGGAGNALTNLKGLNAKGHIISVIGDDENGRLLQEQMHAAGLDTSGLIIADDRPTIVKTRFLAGHQQLLRSDFEKKLPLSQDTQAQLLQKVKLVMNGMNAVILSDYGKGLLSPELIHEIIALARTKNIPVLVDPKGHDYSLYQGATAVTPNKKELAEASALPTRTDEEVVTASRKIIESAGISAVIATRAKDGMSVIRGKNEPVHLRSVDIEVFDVSGAGDTVIATIAAALAAGAELVEAAELANLAGGIVVAKVGTAPVRAQELIDALQGNVKRISRLAPLSSWEEAREDVLRWKARGLKVGFTNGCFDILHAGHVTYLNEARKNCDRLIVGLNHDASVKILKGPERPVHDEISRAIVLGGLSCIDLVVLFGASKKDGDNTACDLITALQPDIYFKGGDYTVDQIPEAPGVQAYGGIVKVMPVVEGQSTTNAITKIKQSAA